MGPRGLGDIRREERQHGEKVTEGDERDQITIRRVISR